MKNQVRESRTRRGLAQGQLAEAMGMSRQTINSIENDRYTPSLPLGDSAGPLLRPAGRGGVPCRLRATAGLAVITAVIVDFLWEIAHGRSGQPYALLGAIAGLACLLTLVWLRWRS